MKSRFAALLLAGIMTLSLVACGQQAAENTASTSEPETIVEQPSIPEGVLAIAEQGMFSAGGTVITSDGTFDVSNYYTSREGSTAHVDHANVLYQIPAEETGLPMVFLHGYGQSRMGWMTTPDGREGWSDMFLKMGHSVFLIDQPRRGEAGQTSVAGTINTEPSDQTWYTQFRIGTYLNDEFTYNEGSQFPAGEEALDQFFRQMTPDTGMDNAGGDQNIDNTVVAQAVAATIDEVYARTGKDSILVTHSQGGMPGWETARYTDHIAAIVAIEPGMAPQVDSDDYKALLEKKIPVTFYYGDYIGEEFTDVPAAAMWGFMASTADTFTTMLCLVGGQGAGKSSFFRLLAVNDDWFSDDLKKLDDENVYRKMQGHWIIEMSEMIATANAKSIEEIKSFLSRQKETYKIPYETHPADRKRQCVFGGSSNTLDFLPLDRTGNRRFVPVMVYPERAEVHILADEQASREYINQMWAEAMEIYRSGNFRLRFSPAMNAYLKAHQKDFMPEDTKAGQILDYLERYSGSMVCSKQLYKEALGHDYDEPKQWELREINDIMNNAVTGWRAFSNPRYFPEPYRRQKGWERIRNDNEPDNSMDGFQEIPTEEMEQLGLPEEWLKQK